MLLDLAKQKLNPSKFADILQQLNKSGQIIHGLTNSAKSFLLANILEESTKPLIFVVQNHYESQTFYQEIENLSSKPVYNFFAQEISPYDQINSDLMVLNRQLEIFAAWQSGEPSLTVMPYKALMQFYTQISELEKTTLVIEKNKQYEPSKLAAKLVELGYKNEFNVEARAQFAQRGDIFDIYPMVGEPVRLEFFGDEIESIRAFNISSQRSNKKLDSFKIHPRYLVQRHEGDGLFEKITEIYNEHSKNLKGTAKATLEVLFESEKASSEEHMYWEGVEYYRALTGQGFSTLFDYLPEDYRLVLDEWEDLSYRTEEWDQQLQKQYQDLIGAGKLLPVPETLHFSVADLRTQIKEHQDKLYLQTISQEVDLGVPKIENSKAPDTSLSYEIATYPGERFASKIDMFVSYLKDCLREHKQVLIFTEQPQRVLGILKEWDINALYIDKSKTEIEQDLNGANHVWVQRDGTHEGFSIPALNLVVLTDRELFGRSRQAIARQKKVIGSQRSDDVVTDISQLRAGDYVVHYKHGIGLYKGTEHISLKNNTAEQVREYLVVEYADESRLMIPIDQINLLSRFNASGDSKPRLSKLGGNEWDRTKKKVKKSVQKIAQDLLNLYAMREKMTGYQYPPDTPWQIEMEDAFPYTETPDQLKAVEEVKNDMQGEKLLDRLICGDAGFGKTEVVIRAIFKAVMDGKQVAVLVPTTVLAQQHFNVFQDRYAPYPLRVGLLCRFKSNKEQKDVIDRLKRGECDVVIGTHRLLQKDLQFRNLGMLVIDEEQRFGVAHKEKLKSMRADLDVITMSATPIPRTLHMALSGAKDISLIKTAPVNRRSIKTFVGEHKSSLIRNAILHELERGGQVFFLHNRVETIEQVAYDLKELIPEASIGIAHGQMKDRDLEDVMFSFVNHEFQVLVCTTIIETGLDIPNANTIIIDQADRMGLSQLYQLRGRVGRSDVQAYAYFLYKPDKEISDTARKRLTAIRELTTIGSGYQVALRDMEIRGVGNVLGAEQHGHMLSVGFDLYCKLLNDTMQELKGSGYESDLEKSVSIDINITAYFPESWISSQEQRMNEYKRLSEVKHVASLDELINEWTDRFGKIPTETENLIEIMRLKLMAKKADIYNISQEAAGIKLQANLRLQKWLPIQRSLSTYLQQKTVFKSGSIGSPNAQPYIMIKTEGMTPEMQLEAVHEVITKILGDEAN